MNIKDIKISDYTYNLPASKIAKYPLKNRESSKLLFFNDGDIKEYSFRDIPNLVPKKTCLVSNNTKVVYARLRFRKSTGSMIEIFCLSPYLPADYQEAFAATHKSRWMCIIGNRKKWKQDEIRMNATYGGEDLEIIARKIEPVDNKHIIEFEWNLPITFISVLDCVGDIPIPPYLGRQAESEDKKTYQTVYSKIEGSVAAPTAGLHFTEDVLLELASRQIQTSEITLHVGAGTFQPVKSDTIGSHAMHTEFFTVTKSALQQIIASLGCITAVGTTSVRTLESLYRMGVKKLARHKDFNFVSQWEIYEPTDIGVKDALEALLSEFDDREELQAHTQILIAPGYRFRVTDALITNFHQPDSTLLLLVAAFIGEDWRQVYDFALENNFRFLSYGDSSLLIPHKN